MAVAQNALQIVVDEAGYNHPVVATSMNNIWLLYKSIGRYEDAEKNYTFALTIAKPASSLES